MKILLLTQEISIESVRKFVIDENIKSIKLYNLSNNYLQKLKKLLNSDVSISFLLRGEYDFRELLNYRSKSYNFIEIVYQNLFNNNQVPVKWAMRYYKDIDIEKAFKKELMNQIPKWLEIVSLSKALSRKDTQIYTLVDKKTHKIIKIFKKLNLNNSKVVVYCPDNLSIFDSLKSYIIFILIPFYIFSKFRISNFIGDRLESEGAIRLHKQSGSVSHKYKLDGCDALSPYLKDKNITYFFVAETIPDSKTISDIERNRDHIVYTDRFFFRSIFLLFLFIFRILKEHFINIIQSIPLFINSSGLFHILLSKLYFDYCKWLCFCENNKIGWYISTNNQDLSSITRNIMLHRFGVKTVHYSQAWTGYYFLKGKDLDFREPNTAFSIYRTHFFLCGRQKEYHQSHNISFVESFISGPLINSSTQYKNSLEDSINLKKDDSKKNISVFPASYLSVSNTNGEEDLIDFLNFIVKASKDKRFQNFEFLIRFKHILPDFEMLSPELKKVLEIISNCHNIVIVDSKYSASFMISLSNFVISMAFTSPTIDALFARVPACFYSNNIQTSDSILDKCNGLIIRNVNDANNSLCMFGDFSDQDFDNYFTNELPIDAFRSQGDIGFKYIANKLALI